MTSRSKQLTAEIKRFLDLHPEWREDLDLLILPPTILEIEDEYGVEDAEDLEGDRMTGYGVTAYALYVRTRRTGGSHRFAKMIAYQQGPALNTDSTLFRGAPKLGDQFHDEREKNNVLRIAKRHGYTPSAGDVYVAKLARFRGDPEAFVPSSGGRGHIRRVCEQRGWQCEGAVNTPYREPETDPWENRIPLAEDLIQSHIREETGGRPVNAAHLKRLREKIIAKHAID